MSVRLQVYKGIHWTKGKEYPSIEIAKRVLDSFGSRPAMKWRIAVRVPAGRRVI